MINVYWFMKWLHESKVLVLYIILLYLSSCCLEVP